jgi:excisionase family DNA binding protein
MSARTTTVVAYNITEAAKRLGLSRWTIHRAILDGKIEVTRTGRSVIIYADDLLDYAIKYRYGRA